MANTDTQESSNGIILKAQFEAYKVWRTLPALLRFPPKNKDGSYPDPKDFAQAMGIEDEEILDLVTIRTKTEFAERFGIARETVTDWENKLKYSPSMVEARNWATSLTKNMLLAMYQHAIKKGHPAVFKLWLQAVEDFKETTRQEIDTPNLAEFNVTIRKKETPKPAPAAPVEAAAPQPVATEHETSTPTENKS